MSEAVTPLAAPNGGRSVRPYDLDDATAHVAALVCGGGLTLLALDVSNHALTGQFGRVGVLFPIAYIVIWCVMGVRTGWALPVGVIIAGLFAVIVCCVAPPLLLLGMFGTPILLFALPLILGAVAAIALAPWDRRPGLFAAHAVGALAAGFFLCPIWLGAELPYLSLHSEPLNPRVTSSTASDVGYGLAIILCFAPHTGRTYVALAAARREGRPLGPERPGRRVAAILLALYLAPASVVAWKGESWRGLLWPLTWADTKNEARAADRIRLEREYREREG